MNWKERMAAASTALSYPTVETFEDEFKTKIGITEQSGGIGALDDEDIFKFGDFREAFKDKAIAPLRIAFRSLRGGKGQAEAADPRLQKLQALGLKVKIDDAETSVLLPHYDPNKPSDPVTNVLRKRYGERRIIAFKDDGNVALDESLHYINDLEQGFPESEAGTIWVDGRLTPLFPIGIKPERMVDEDPLFPGRPLRDNISLVNGRNWTKVTLQNRQLSRIVVERGEINVDSREAVLHLMERAAGDYASFAEAYPEADLEFRKREKKGELPKLKVELGSATTKSNYPFGTRR